MAGLGPLATKILFFLFINQVFGVDEDVGRSAPLPSGPPCLSLRTTTLDLYCHFDGKPVPCNGPMLTNTKADIQCKRGFKLPVNPGYSTVTCLPSGVWDRDLYKCNPECGLPKPKDVRLESGEKELELGEFPWHAIVYKKHRDGVNKPVKIRICSGTIINEKMIVSAAFCYEAERNEDRPALEDFSVAVGKLNSDYYVDEPNAQLIDVQRIVDNGYRGLENNFANDLAILVLVRNILFSDYIKPICVDWNFKGDSTMPADIEGVVVGWKEAANGSLEPIPNALEIKTISRENCIQKASVDFLQYVTEDKFCAADERVVIGFGGAGFAVKQQKDDHQAYYLRGMVSVGEHGAKSNIFALTNILRYIDWLLEQEIIYIFG